MTLEQVRSFYTAEPFVPFVIHLADGREIPVHHREFIMAAPSGRILIVCQPDDSFNWIDLLLVTDLEVKPRMSGTGKRRKGL
ncbi:MAG: hypothetical protein WD872_11760 [Pirellulaceae bacterium]